MFKETLVSLLNVNKSTINFNKLNITNSVEKVKNKNAKYINLMS